MAQAFNGDKARKKDSKLVGDGNQPNMFFVTAYSSFQALDDRDHKFTFWTDPAEVDPIFKEWIIPHSETWGPYHNYRDAWEKFWEIYQALPEVPKVRNEFHSVVIEDRLSGELAEGGLRAERYKNEWSRGWKFHKDFHEDLRFTIKKMGFDIRQYNTKPIE